MSSWSNISIRFPAGSIRRTRASSSSFHAFRPRARWALQGRVQSDRALRREPTSSGSTFDVVVAEPILVTFVGGDAGAWAVESIEAVTGAGLPPVARLAVIE